MEYIFGSTSPTEMWYSKLKYKQPGVHCCQQLNIAASFSHLATLISALLWVLAVLTIPYLAGTEVISRGTVHTNKLKSLKVAKWRKDEWRMTKDDWRMMKDERWRMDDDDFKLLKGFALRLTDRRTDRRTDICDCRVAFATEKLAFQPK